MVSGGFACLRRRLAILSPASALLTVEFLPTVPFIYPQRLGVHSGVKLCEPQSENTEKGWDPYMTLQKNFTNGEEGCRRGGACSTDCPRLQSRALLVCELKQARLSHHRHPPVPRPLGSLVQPRSRSSLMEGEVCCCSHEETAFSLVCDLRFGSVFPSDLRRFGAQKNFFPSS